MLNKSSHKLVHSDYDMSGVKENDRLLLRGRQSSNLEGQDGVKKGLSKGGTDY